MIDWTILGPAIGCNVCVCRPLQALFNEVDADSDGTISISEWYGFWSNVIKQPAYADDIDGVVEEIQEIILVDI